MRKPVSFNAVAVAVLATALAVPAFAGAAGIAKDRPWKNTNVTPPDAQAPAWGTSTASIKNVFAFDFVPVDSGAGYSDAGIGKRYWTGGGLTTGLFDHTLDLPSGALLTQIQLVGCDSSATGEVGIVLLTCDNLGSDCGFTNGPATGQAPLPGCATFTADLVPAVTIDNAQTVYALEASLDTSDGTTSFRGVRAFYQLQISPAPAIASFTDVPTTYWAFQHIEALKSSGITTGCDPTHYCPNNNVTRAEMAVFLARALGLHWPN